MFNTPYNMKQKTPPEQNSGEIKVDKLGYCSPKVRIENMIAAGQRLKDYRESQYDFPKGEIDVNYIDPTRSPSYDMADAFQDSIQIDAKLAEQQAAADAAAAEQKAADEAAAKASQAAYNEWLAIQNTQSGVNP